MVSGCLPGRAQLHARSQPDRVCALHQQVSLRTVHTRQPAAPSAVPLHLLKTRPCLQCRARNRQQQAADEDGLRETEAVAGASVQDDLAAELAEAEEAASMSQAQLSNPAPRLPWKP